MPSEKLIRVLKKMSPFTDEQIEAMSEGEGWAWLRNNYQPKPKVPTICFTGFSQYDEDMLAQKAASINLKVVSGITKSLSFLCTGDNPGPVKLQKAHEQGVTILDLQQFESLVRADKILSGT